MERDSNNESARISSSSKAEDKHPLTPQIQEYCEKFSSSSKLSKYFSGPFNNQDIPSTSRRLVNFRVIPTISISEDTSVDQTTIAVATEDHINQESIAINTDDIIKPQQTIAVNTEEVFEDAIKPSIAQTTRPPLIGQDFSEPPPVNNENVCPSSPASSVTSNRKLEWDNGADIGYNNVETQRILQKSISLPVLSDLEYKKFQKDLLRSSPEGNIVEIPKLKQINSDSDSDFDSKLCFNPPYSSSSTENTRSAKRSYSSSSSSAGALQKRSSADSKSSSSQSQNSENILRFLKGKVGLPIAESTPITQIIYNKKFEDFLHMETPRTIISGKHKDRDVPREIKESKSSSCEHLQQLPKEEDSLKKWHSQIDINMVDQVSHYKNLKILKLSVSKPVVVECTTHQTGPTAEDKLIQTSLPRNASIAVQTDFDFSDCKHLKPEQKLFEKQSVIYVCHSDSDEEQNVHSSGTQTISDVLSNRCNSFEYLYGEEYDQKFANQPDHDNSPLEVAANEKEEEAATTSRALVGNLKRCPPKTNLTSVATESNKTTSTASQITSKDSPLAQLLATKPSDLENNLVLLQKVMKSKKYDDVTKKFYLKRIIQTFLDIKLSTDDDSSGSYNSLPDLSKETSSTSPEELNLQENKPWVPASQPSNSQKRLKPRNLEVQTFTNEILPEESCKLQKFVPIKIVQDRQQRNSLFTVTDGGGLNLPANVCKLGASGDSSNSTANELYEALRPHRESEQTTPVISSNTNSSEHEKIEKSWRENKTKSEELFEQRNRAKDDRGKFEKDHLIHFANKERKHQLCWIKNEILHLSKLKKLLEQKSETNNETLRTVVQKPHVENMKGFKKSTTVYIVTTEKSSGESSSKYSSNNEEIKCSVCNLRTCKNPNCPAHQYRPYSAISSSSKDGIQRPSTAATSNYKSLERDKQIRRPLTASTKSPPPPLPPPPPSQLPSLIGHSRNVISIGSEEINLNKARLISSEQFATEANDGQTRATVRRYTFEITEEQPDCRAVTQSAPPSPKKSSQTHTTPTDSGRLSCELVLTDDNKSPPECPPESNKEVSKCNDKITQTSQSLIEVDKCSSSSSGSSKSSSSSSSSSTGSSTTTNLCRCCKTEYIKAPKGPPNAETDSPKYILCHPCYNQSLRTNFVGTQPNYTFPGHVCRCHNGVQAETIQEMRNTLEELQKLERKDDYCKCQSSRLHPTSDYCLNCNCKLRKKGIAYMLTLESDEQRHHKQKKKQRKPSLQEIKIKVPSPRKHKKSKKILIASSENKNSTDDESTKENSTKNHRHSKTNSGGKRKGRRPTLQEYLCVNKPDFVASAEQRRRCLIDLAYMREQRCQKYKQLLALTTGIPLQNSSSNIKNSKPKRVIPPKEMKKITEKNYKKLPEVQQKLIDNRERQIKKANKLLADIFNQKLREQVLKGKHTIAPDASIIKLI